MQQQPILFPVYNAESFHGCIPLILISDSSLSVILVPVVAVVARHTTRHALFAAVLARLHGRQRREAMVAAVAARAAVGSDLRQAAHAST